LYLKTKQRDYCIAAAEWEEQVQDDELLLAASEAGRTPIAWQDLKTNPGAVDLKSVLHEIDRVGVPLQLALPADLFEKVSRDLRSHSIGNGMSQNPSLNCAAILT
jgi:hypothetical protein